MRIVVGSTPLAAGRKEFERLGRRLAGVAERWTPVRAVVEVNLVGRRRMSFLNRTYRGRRGAAEILTFSYSGSAPRSQAEGPIGELYLCWPPITRRARELGVSTRAYVLRLFVHGLVHLRGHTHDSWAHQARMEAVEKKLLRELVSRRDAERLFRRLSEGAPFEWSIREEP